MPASTHAPAPADAVARTDFTLVADDDRALAANWTEPASGTPHAVTVIHGAVGVPRRYYQAFAGWLASRGHAVLSYDYRGIGGSRLTSPRDEPATLRDWALRDMPAAIAAAEARRRDAAVPLLMVGHSFGGNCIAFARGVERSDALLLVASQIPVLRHFAGWRRATAWLFFRHWVPAMTRWAGHLPAWANGGGEPLPPGVALQWCDWGLREAWAFSDPGMQAHDATPALRSPVHLWNVSDDLMYAPPGAVDALAARFDRAAVQRHAVTPRSLGLSRLGHFGAFRRAAGTRLWPRLLAPLEGAVPRLRAAGLQAAASAASMSARSDAGASLGA